MFQKLNSNSRFTRKPIYPTLWQANTTSPVWHGRMKTNVEYRDLRVFFKISIATSRFNLCISFRNFSFRENIIRYINRFNLIQERISLPICCKLFPDVTSDILLSYVYLGDRAVPVHSQVLSHTYAIDYEKVESKVFWR